MSRQFPSLSDVVARLADPEADPADVADLLRFDPARSCALKPYIEFDLDRLEADVDAGLLQEGPMALIRRRRQRRYEARIEAGWRGPRLVAGGDSWFQFPLTRDIVHQLDADHAIHCLSGATDLLHNLLGQQRLCEAVVEHRPDAIILSVGGSDLLDPFRIAAFAKLSAPGPNRADGTTAYLDQFLGSELMPRLAALLHALRRADPAAPILLHSYAPAIPRNFIWLGHPLRSRGIGEKQRQQRIIAAIIDRFHEALAALVVNPVHANVHIVDCRGAVGAHWFDELHPNDTGFEQVSRLFRARIADLV